jgi:predicted regulator of Ras-like GTPase activity (Roadblock/LC7/MglB family)
MASAIATEKIRSEWRVLACDHDPGAATAQICSADGGTTLKYIDLRDYDAVGVSCMATIFGDASDITLLEIIASDTVAFSSVVVIKTSGTIALNAIGDQAWLECTAEEVQHLATTYDLRYVAARITCGHAGHEAVVTYFAHARRPHTAITPSTIIAGTETA